MFAQRPDFTLMVLLMMQSMPLGGQAPTREFVIVYPVATISAAQANAVRPTFDHDVDSQSAGVASCLFFMTLLGRWGWLSPRSDS
jgi:hypothetical protein